MYLEIKLIGHKVDICLYLWGIPKNFQEFCTNL